MTNRNKDKKFDGPGRWRRVMESLTVAFVLSFAFPFFAYAEQYAMVIGISEYDYSSTREGIVSLEYPEKDARDLELSLQAKGYTVIPLTNDNAKREDIMDAFTELRGIINRDDSFLLFFAGHGLREANINHTFWLTHNTKLTNLDDNGIRLAHLLDYVADIKASRKLVLLDHCFSGDMRFGTSGPENSRDVSFNRPEISRGALPVDELGAISSDQSAGMAVLAAARDQAFENPELENGVFTEALIKAMDSRDADINEDGKLSVTELEQYLSTEVVRLSETMGTPQTPVSVINAQGLAEWNLFDLPVVEPDTVQVSSVYKVLLARWAVQDPSWINPQAKVRIYHTLSNWIDAKANLTLLDSIDRKAMQALEGNMNFVTEGTVDEKTIAEILNEELKVIYGIE